MGSCSFDYYSWQVRRTSISTGATYRLTGDIPGLSAITFAPDGKLYVGNTNGALYRVDPVTGAQSTFAVPGAGINALTSDATHA